MASVAQRSRLSKQLPMQAVRYALGACVLLAGCGDDQTEAEPSAASEKDAQTPESAATNFFVTSDKSRTGNLGGLAAADARCQRLADEARLPGTWIAYLSVESDPDNAGAALHARDRIGDGPWYNSRGEMLAADLDALHARKGDAELFLDENGEKVPGQWAGSPQPNEHDILTGSDDQGRLAAGQTCADWTSEAATNIAMVGHSDGLGPGGNGEGFYAYWAGSHQSGGCHDTSLRGGAGRIYCFARP